MGTVTQYNLQNVQDALGGSHPISMNEYYRGGSFVPTTATTTTRDPTSGSYYNDQYIWRSDNYGGGVFYVYFFWASVIQYVVSPGSDVTSYTSGNVTTFRGTLNNSYFSKGVIVSQYRIFRETYSTTSINTGVPSSGTISISQLFGARNP
jgi:hypothetical protein